MLKDSGGLPCQKGKCDGYLIFIEYKACYERWRCHKCGTPHQLSHKTVAKLKKPEGV